MIKYPFTINDLMNTDSLAKAILLLQEEVKNFVVANTIKYADPIQWNITTQYERNTVVIDPLTGTAYISVQPVPMGISLANTDYWTVVFNLSEFVTRAARNFSLNYEENTTLTATFPTVKGGWVVWNDTLYVANVNITPGDQYVDEVGGNITRITMESIIGNMDNLLTIHKDNMVNIINEVFNAYSTLNAIIGDMSTLDVPDVTTVVEALNVIYTAVDNIANAIIEISGNIGDLADLNTTDKTSIVAAVNEVLDDIGELTDLNTEDKSDIVAAINEVDTNIGDLNDLVTTDKSSIVNSINEVASTPGVDYITPEMFGAIGNGAADDTIAIKNAVVECLSSGKNLYFKSDKTYLITDTIDFGFINYDILMDGLIVYDGVGVALQVTRAINHRVDINVHSVSESNTSTGFKLLRASDSVFNIKDITGFEVGLDLTGTDGGIAYNIFNLGTIADHHYGIKISSNASGWCNENTFIGGRIMCWSTSSYRGTDIGIIIDGSNYLNNNVFYHPSLESNYKCIVIEKGKYNSFYNCRFENSTYGVITNNNSVHNHITYCGEPVPTHLFTANNGTSYWNEVISTQTFTPYKVFDSGDIFNIVRTCSDYDIAGDYLFGLSNNNKSKVYNIDRQNGYIRTAALWVEIKGLDNVNLIGIQINADANTSPLIKFFDSSNNEITNISSPTGIGSYNASGYDSNGYYQGDSRESGIIRWICVPETCTHVYIGTRVTGATKLYSMQIYAINNTKYVTSEGYVPTMPYAVAHDLSRGLTRIPTGFGIHGEYVMNVGSDTTIKGWYYDGAQWQADYFNTTP